MVPLLAATSAISAVSKLSSGAVSAWNQLTGSGQAGGKKSAAQAPGSFAELLSAHGVAANSQIGSAASALLGTTPGHAGSSGSHPTAQSAASRLLNRIA